MSIFSPKFIFFFIINILSLCNSINNHPVIKSDHRTTIQQFWEFDHQSDAWVEVKLPYDLITCINGDCRVVGSIQQSGISSSDDDHDHDHAYIDEAPVLPAVRKRISITRMSEASVWVTGPSGSIFERFWNGVQWVVAPHDLQVSAGYAVSVFIVNQTILALSEPGLLFQLQLTEESQPIWAELDKEVQISSGILSDDKKLYFCTKNGTLLELLGADPSTMWVNHGRPPGAAVVGIADGAVFKPGLVFTVSGAGDLYEHDRTSKPPWKKHIRREGSRDGTHLSSSKACSLYGVFGARSASLFLLTKSGQMIERRLHQRKWKWVVHGNPKGHPLTSITCISQDDPNTLFTTSTSGVVFEYCMQKSHDPWLNHEHPVQAPVASGVPGLQLQPGRLIFVLDDGRLGELHLSGHGGDTLGPNAPISTRRKSMLKYVWSVIDTPETEGWNAEYCTDERGPSNCIAGTKEETLTSKWRKDSKRTQISYLLPVAPDSAVDDLNKGIADRFFHLRLMQERTSFFLVTKNGLMLEYLSAEDAWLWLRHEHPSRMESVVGSYNGSLFVVDENGSLLIRERSSVDLTWTNCTAMRKGRQVSSGPPWDSIPGQKLSAKLEDSIFLVSRKRRLLQFMVALRKFKWKDCRNPPGVKISSIVDQERFRENIVFVVGKNGRLYQYNKVTELWHEHYQSQHLILSRAPGTAMRPTMKSLEGSLFMLSKDGGLVEYAWSLTDGWNWVEHGTPHTNVTLVGAPGPCFGGTEVFLIGSDGDVYLRYFNEGEWKWRNYGFPVGVEEKHGDEETDTKKGFGDIQETLRETDDNCDTKVSNAIVVKSNYSAKGTFDSHNQAKLKPLICILEKFNELLDSIGLYLVLRPYLTLKLTS